MIYGRKYSLCHVHYAVFTWCGAMRCIRSRREINLSRYSLAAQARGIVYFTRSSAISMHQIELFLLFHSGNPRMTIVLLINSDSINTNCSFSSFFNKNIFALFNAHQGTELNDKGSDDFGALSEKEERKTKWVWIRRVKIHSLQPLQLQNIAILLLTTATCVRLATVLRWWYFHVTTLLFWEAKFGFSSDWSVDDPLSHTCTLPHPQFVWSVIFKDIGLIILGAVWIDSR